MAANVSFRSFRVDADFQSLCFRFFVVVFLPHKQGIFCESRTPGDFCSQRTGLELWTNAISSVSIRVREKRCCGPISQLYPFERSDGNLTENLVQHSGF